MIIILLYPIPARNLLKDINIKIIQRNYGGEIRKGYET